MNTGAKSARNYVKRVSIFFLGATIFWGTLFGLWLGLSIGLSKGVVYGLGGGSIVALAIVLLGIVFDLSFRMKIAEKYGTEQPFDIVQNREFLLLGDYGRIREHCIDSLKSISGSEQVEIGNEDGSLSANTRSWKTSGEKIQIQLAPATNGVRVRISSKPRLITAVFDCGKNIEHVERICSSLETGA